MAKDEIEAFVSAIKRSLSAAYLRWTPLPEELVLKDGSFSGRAHTNWYIWRAGVAWGQMNPRKPRR